VVPPINDELCYIPFLGVFDWFAFDVDGSDWANFGAFAAGSAGAGFAPVLI
jgi:hypothetical protein